MKCCRDNLKANLHLCDVLCTERKIRIKYHLLNQSIYAMLSKPMNKKSLTLYRILWISCRLRGAGGHGSLHFRQESLLFVFFSYLDAFKVLPKNVHFLICFPSEASLSNLIKISLIYSIRLFFVFKLEISILNAMLFKCKENSFHLNTKYVYSCIIFLLNFFFLFKYIFSFHKITTALNCGVLRVINVNNPSWPSTMDRLHQWRK